MEPWTVWLIIAVVLLIVEVLTQMMWALCLGIGAIAAMLCSLFGVPGPWPVACLFGTALGTYAAVLPYIKRRHARTSARQARTGMDALVGRRAIITEAVSPGKTGRARIDGDNWQVCAPDLGHDIPAGTEVVVTGYDSIILSVTVPGS